MKKLLMLVMAMCLTLGAYAAPELSKKQQKQVNKEVKAKMKEYKKDGWKVFGTSRTLEAVLTDHISNIVALDEDGYELVGISNNFKSKSVGHQQAVNNACIEYAGKAGSTVRGLATTDLKANGTDENDEFEHFYAAYQRNVEREIKNEMTETYSVIRETVPGRYEMQTFFIVNESAAAKARARAAEQAMKETEVAQAHASKISDFVRKAFER